MYDFFDALLFTFSFLRLVDEREVAENFSSANCFNLKQYCGAAIVGFLDCINLISPLDPLIGTTSLTCFI